MQTAPLDIRDLFEVLKVSGWAVFCDGFGLEYWIYDYYGGFVSNKLHKHPIGDLFEARTRAEEFLKEFLKSQETLDVD